MSGSKPLPVEFCTGALAAVGAGCFTNPIDLIKIRLQLQGELEARGTYKRIYRGTLHAAYVIVKHEGVLALQTGIVPALAFQVVLNGTRLGIFNAAKKHELISNQKGKTSIYKTVLVAGFAGAFGAVIGSPFYLVKTQLQSYSASGELAVGHQHQHKGTWDAFRNLYNEGGVAAWYRGWHAAIPRLFLGSASQLTTFSLATDWLKSLNFQIFESYPLLLTFVASFIGGSSVAVLMQPADVLATRIYNQSTTASGKGSTYNGLWDAFLKILKTEGFFGLYKGVFPTWIRIAPHTVLCLVFYEKLDKLHDEYMNS